MIYKKAFWTWSNLDHLLSPPPSLVDLVLSGNLIPTFPSLVAVMVSAKIQQVGIKEDLKILLGCDTHPHCSGWSLGVSESVFNHSKKDPLFVFGATPCLEEGRLAWWWLCQTCSPAELWSLSSRPLWGSRYGAWLCHNPPVGSFFQSGQNIEI